MALYPPIEPFLVENVRVDDTHTLFVQHFGTRNGKPAIYLHGGPGGGHTAEDARRFDPKAYWVIAFDQRGAGKSTPSSCLIDNTTQHLISDIELLRERYGIEKSVRRRALAPLTFKVGGSWGSSLSLYYSQAHPSRVSALVLRGIFTLRREELEFFYGSGRGTRYLFPDEWDRYASVIPEDERHDMIAAFHKRLTGEDKEVRQTAARCWTRWEMATSRLRTDPDMLEKADSDEFADVFARIEAHYFVNAGFMREGQLLEKAEIVKIRDIPAVIIQGRYDCVCPAISAWDLHKAWPEAKFIICPTSGHSAHEAEIEAELVKATDSFRPSPKDSFRPSPKSEAT